MTATKRAAVRQQNMMQTAVPLPTVSKAERDSITVQRAAWLSWYLGTQLSMGAYSRYATAPHPDIGRPGKESFLCWIAEGKWCHRPAYVASAEGRAALDWIVEHHGDGLWDIATAVVAWNARVQETLGIQPDGSDEEEDPLA